MVKCERLFYRFLFFVFLFLFFVFVCLFVPYFYFYLIIKCEMFVLRVTDVK